MSERIKKDIKKGLKRNANKPFSSRKRFTKETKKRIKRFVFGKSDTFSFLKSKKKK